MTTTMTTTPTLVTIGDSLTEHGTWQRAVCDETGRSVVNLGASGQTSFEIALRLGAVHLTLLITDDGIVPRDPFGPVRVDLASGMRDIEAVGRLGDHAGTLRHAVSAGASSGWTFEPRVPATLPTGAELTFVADRHPVAPGALVTVWCGRNDANVTAAERIAAITDVFSDHRTLVLGVPLGEFEPRGSAGYRDVTSLNDALAARFGERFVDVSAALSAGSADGTTPAALRTDAVHLNANGDAVVATAIVSRARALGWLDD